MRAAARRTATMMSPHAWLLALALLLSIPSFYVQLLDGAIWTRLTYGAAAALVAANGWLARHERRSTPRSGGVLDAALITLLVSSALAASSLDSNLALSLRLVASGLMLLRTVVAFEPLLMRGHLASVVMIAAVMLALCGLGYWKLEPTIHTLPDGLWLAFVTASTLGYGDFVPTVAASRILSVFVVLLGYGTLSLVTATVAARWVGREEREIEHEVLRELHAEIAALRRELHQTQEALRAKPPEG